MKSPDADLQQRNAALRTVYDGIERRVSESLQNFVPPLAVVLDAPKSVRFLSASSVAIQSIVPPSHQSAFIDIAALYRKRFPEMAARTFWQPEGTLHLNVAILRRLSPPSTDDHDLTQLMHLAAPVLHWLDEQPAYEIVSMRVLLAADGTLMAVGYLESLLPWTIRQSFANASFADQQSIFHVTIGRLLEVLPEREWRAVVDFTKSAFRERRISPLPVRDAILINEREGYLHAPRCYDVIRRFVWR